MVATVINDKVISLGGGENRIDLTSAFTDADSDHLTFTASSSDTGIATVSIIGALMVINPLSMGMTTITVMADDNKGGTISQTFNVKVDKMVIFEQSEGIPLTRNQSTTQDLKLTVNIFENAQVNKIRLEFTNVTLDISKFDPMFKMFGHYYSFFYR
ncbi:Ig-like domain-containing protein [Lysinibacillus capsici]|uniref:Ig-like domain-containing protein n=1 Tax=Lysinibacillus capsici TaxID=2115968 RepID=UPI003D80B12B